MRRSWVWCIAALASAPIAGCPSSSDVGGEIPPDVAYVALIDTNDDGTVRGSPLASVAERAPLTLFAQPNAEHHLIGFRDAQLAPGLSLSDAWLDQPLRPALGCESSLPRASWQARLTRDGELVEEDPGDDPFTVDGLTGICKDLPASRIAIDVSCRDEICLADVLRQGCSFRFDLSGCGLPSIEMQLGAFGDACIDGAPIEGCAPSTPTEDALAEMRCTINFDGIVRECRIAALEVPELAPFDVAIRKTVVDLEPYVWRGAWLTTGLLREGALYSMAVTATQVFVTAGISSTERIDCGVDDVRPPPATSLHRFDVETGALLSITDVPPCLHQLVPIGDGVIGVHPGGDGRWWYVRLDAAGTVTSSRAVGADVRWDEYRANELMHWSEMDRVVLLTDTSSLATLHMASATDLSISPAIDILEPRCLHASEYNGRVDVACSSFQLRGRVLQVDLASKLVAEDGRFVPGRLVRSAYDFGDVHLGPTGTTFAVTRDLRGVFTWNGGDDFTPYEYYEKRSEPGGFADWTPDPTLVLVTGMTISFDDSRSTNTINLLDKRVGRFRPGTWSLGNSVISATAWDTSNRLWLLLPWSGELVRIDPRRP